MKIEIRDSDGILHTQECDDYNYNVDTKSVLCYEVDGDNKKLIAAYEDISHFRKLKE